MRLFCFIQRVVVTLVHRKKLTASHPLRQVMVDAKRVIVKVGTVVVSREEDSCLAIGRIGCLVEQVVQNDNE